LIFLDYDEVVEYSSYIMRFFILEDDHRRIKTFRSKLIGHELVIAENAQDAIRILSDDQAFDVIFLDHDLGGEQMVSSDDKNTGSEVARWMKSYLKQYCPVIIHSLNPDGAKYMRHALEDVAMEVYYIPFTSLADKLDDPSFITQ